MNVVNDVRNINWHNAIVQIVAFAISWMFAGYLMTFVTLPVVLSITLKYTLRFILKVVLVGILFMILSYVFPKWYTSEETFNINPNIVTINEFDNDFNNDDISLSNNNDNSPSSSDTNTNGTKSKKFHLKLCPGWLKNQLVNPQLLQTNPTNSQALKDLSQDQNIQQLSEQQNLHEIQHENALLPPYLQSIPKYLPTTYIEHMSQLSESDLTNAYNNTQRDPFWGTDLVPLKTMYMERRADGIKERIQQLPNEPSNRCVPNFIPRKAEKLGWPYFPWTF